VSSFQACILRIVRNQRRRATHVPQPEKLGTLIHRTNLADGKNIIGAAVEVAKFIHAEGFIIRTGFKPTKFIYLEK
jgi:hypothetical protein